MKRKHIIDLEDALKKFTKGLKHTCVEINGRGEITTYDLCRLGIDLISEVEQLRSALERIRPVPSLILQGKSVRNLDEIYAECDRALEVKDD